MEEVTPRRGLPAFALALVFATSGLGVLAAPALADPTNAVDEAKAHFKTGTDLYDENNFRGALVEFQRAYQLAPNYHVLYNIGQVDMELADYAGALVAYSRYLREGGPDVSADRVTEVKGEIDRLSGRVGKITVQTAAGAEVIVDDISVGYAPLPESVTVNIGRHKVTVRAQGKPAVDRVVDVAGQQDLTVALANEAPAAVPPPATVAEKVVARSTAPAGPPSNVPKYVAWTATGAFAITAGTFAYLAHTDDDNLSKLRSTFPVTKSELDAERSKETRSAAISDAFTAATVITAGVALYLTLRHHSSHESPGSLVSMRF